MQQHNSLSRDRVPGGRALPGPNQTPFRRRAAAAETHSVFLVMFCVTVA